MHDTCSKPELPSKSAHDITPIHRAPTLSSSASGESSGAMRKRRRRTTTMRTAVLILLDSMVLSAAAMPRERRSYRRETQRINGFKRSLAEERRLMRAIIGVMAIAGFFGLFMPAQAQTRFDGTYQLSY